MDTGTLRPGSKARASSDSDVENRLVIAKVKGGREELEIWDEQMQTIVYRMDKQQSPIVQPRELYSTSCDKS